jgi:pantoate--beta-alanine ligase
MAEMIKKGEQSTKIAKDFVYNEYSSTIPMGTVDYIEIVDPNTIEPVDEITSPVLVAVALHVGKARLIDNILIEV